MIIARSLNDVYCSAVNELFFVGQSVILVTPLIVFPSLFPPRAVTHLNTSPQGGPAHALRAGD